MLVRTAHRVEWQGPMPAPIEERGRANREMQRFALNFLLFVRKITSMDNL